MGIKVMSCASQVLQFSFKKGKNYLTKLNLLFNETNPKAKPVGFRKQVILLYNKTK